MKRYGRMIGCVLMCAILLLTAGCTAPAPVNTATPTPAATAAPTAETKAYQKFSGVFFESFDTITTLIGYAREQETFDREFARVEALFKHYHQIFDAYNKYEGINNLWHVNENAGKEPVKAEKELIDLLLWLKEKQPVTQGKVNVAMGSMLRVWHNYRTVGEKLPAMSELTAAMEHSDFDKIVIDEVNGTVQFLDHDMLLDLGAVAKGYTVEIVAQYLLQSEMPSFIISAGGNVRCGKAPEDGRTRWGVGIQDPELTSNNKDVLFISGLSAVTSGDYQRYYEVDNVRYHHLIDPVTLMPGNYMRSVTVVTEDSGLADLLSTTLFLMPYEEGKEFVKTLDGVDAYWVLNDGTVRYSDGICGMLRSLGVTAYD
ncbi:MAG: FAD:protein FMN transferase [Clostridia bacterium]|nr:FAD:protein FMN transferase [Clostridia bacterium]